jgi:predicted lysophospholipase L1 biosynthesis ABC-type transport system permease subunit
MPVISGCESCGKEEAMQIPTEGKSETPATEEKKKKRKRLDRFLTFLSMGGFILIIAAIIGIIMAIAYLTHG